RYPWTGQDRGMVSNGEKSRERRQWVRFILPNMVTRLSWANGTETVTHLVSLVNVSANGAAVNMDVKPVTDRPCMIHFENGDISARPIPGNLVAMETTDSGRILAKFAFDSVLADRDLILHQRERRACQRVVPRERRACLSWRVGDDTVSVPGEVQNISGGGVAVQTDVAPPRNQTIWLSLGPVGEEAGPAECRLVGFGNDQSGKLIARFSFVDLCPLQLYQAAIEIPK
ncbi:MAG: PilZ domain-containing protein, partial [Isosphaeraceae bacterium]